MTVSLLFIGRQLTSLHQAAYEGSRSDVEALLNQGADIHATANIAVDGHRWEGVTPLHMATPNPDMAVAELLLDRGCRYPRCSNGQRSLVLIALALLTLSLALGLACEGGEIDTRRSRRQYRKP